MLSDDERAQRLADLNELIDLIRPAVQADGGDLVLVSADVEAGTVEVSSRGRAAPAPSAAPPCRPACERILTERLDWITEVIGGVDEDIDYETSAAMGRGGYTPGW